MSSAVSRRPRRTTAALLVATVIAGSTIALPGSAVSASAATASDLRSISGTITLPAGTPSEWMRGVHVEAWPASESGGSFAIAWPNPATGRYTLNDLAPGQYHVRFESSSSPTIGDPGRRSLLADEFYRDAPDLASAEAVDVADASATGIDAALDLGASISGIIDLSALPRPDPSNVLDVEVTLTTVDGTEIYRPANGGVVNGNWRLSLHNLRGAPTGSP
jgi:hypothetical protein